MNASTHSAVMTARLAALQEKPWVPTEPEINDNLAENTGGGDNPRSRLRYMLTSLRDNVTDLARNNTDLMPDLVGKCGSLLEAEQYAAQHESMFSAYVHLMYPALIKVMQEFLETGQGTEELFSVVENMRLTLWRKQIAKTHPIYSYQLVITPNHTVTIGHK